MIKRPLESHVPEYYRRYTVQVKGDDLLVVLESSLTETAALFGSITGAREEFRYAPGKWNPKQVLSHISDCERVFTYRALRFARADVTGLPSIDENLFAENDNSGSRSVREIVAEFTAVRRATIEFYKSLSEEMLERKGMANNTEFTPRVLGWIVAGHCRHHCAILEERYLKIPLPG
jgi:hypothetical protein